jgi:hypothetical protein
VTKLQTVSALVAVGVLAAAGSAPADRDDKFGAFYADCWFSPKSGKLTVKTKSAEEARVVRRGKKVSVLALDEARCKGGRATVRNTRRISFVLKGDGITEGHVSLAGGPLGPGRGAETAGAPEIEINVTAPGFDKELHLDGGPGADQLRAGQLGNARGFNLNPGAELLAPDSDLTLRGKGSRSIVVDPGRGDDTIDLGGGSEFVGPLGVGFAYVELGPGADRFVGSLGWDMVLAGPGLDVVSTGAGDDGVHSQDGVAEKIDCGDGTDTFQADPQDILVSCEEPGFVGLAP